MVLLSLSLFGATSLAYLAQFLSPQYIYRKDFIQEYLLAKAALQHVYPYLPVSHLAGLLLQNVPNEVFPHPTPHPPAVALLFLPLGWLPYHYAVVVWFVVQVGCMFLSLSCVARCVEAEVGPGTVLVMTLMAVAWAPFALDLLLGQLMALKLLLLAYAWRGLRAGKHVVGGIFLGAAVALKLIAWPLVLLLLLKRSWTAAGTAGGVMAAANGLAAFVMGPHAVLDYYSRVGTLVASLYRAHVANFSLWSLAWRLCDGTDSPVICGFKAAPLVYMPEMAGRLAFIPPLLLLLAGVCLALRAATFDASFAVMTCVSVLVSPVAWCCYLALAVIPIAFCLRRLAELGFPPLETKAGIVTGLLLLLPPAALNQLMLVFADANLAGACRPTVPFAVALVGLVPAVATVALMWLVSRVEKKWSVSGPGCERAGSAA